MVAPPLSVFSLALGGWHWPGLVAAGVQALA